MEIIKMETQIIVNIGGTPNICKAAVIPMNSVTIVRKSKMPKSINENQPQNEPKASNTASACPSLGDRS
jgi:hypothetical protein